MVVVSTVVIKSAKRKDPDRCAFWFVYSSQSFYLSESLTYSSLLQASFILVPTLGLTWLLGFFVVGNDVYSTIVEWIFFACTTLQGLAIFVIHCVLNTEVNSNFTYIQVSKNPHCRFVLPFLSVSAVTQQPESKNQYFQ